MSILVVTLNQGRIRTTINASRMSVVRDILRFLRKTDEVDTISKVTKEFLEQNDTSAVLAVIDDSRSSDKVIATGAVPVEDHVKYVVKKNGKSYIVRKVGSSHIAAASP